jgi:hypothetical protein
MQADSAREIGMVNASRQRGEEASSISCYMKHNHIIVADQRQKAYFICKQILTNFFIAYFIYKINLNFYFFSFTKQTLILFYPI